MRPYGLRGYALPWLLLDCVLPTRCFCCGARLTAVQSRGACGSCWYELAAAIHRTGRACGRAPMICAVEYTPTARQFLLRAKFGHRRELFEPLAGMLTAAIRSSGIRPDCVVPVPSHPWSGFTRGFSPATELARPVAHGLGRPLRRVVTRRWFPWTSAKRLSRAERLRFSVRAFRLSGNIEGQSILLVDDLVTTGSTLARCIRLCEEGGAVCVRVLVWASKQADDGG